MNAIYEAVGAEVVEAVSSDKTLKQLCKAVEKAVAKQRRLLVSATKSVIGTPGAGTPPSAAAACAAVAPLLGLLGTVVGMIRTFKTIAAFGAQDARLLADRIREALITTEWVL